MWSRRSVLLGAAASAVATTAWAEGPGDWSSDIAILREAFEALHPGLYRYATPREMSARFDALARVWSRPQPRAAAYLSLSRFLATVKCGHTYANFYNQSETVRTELFDPWPRLPFHFVWLGGRMVVVRNFCGDARLAPGAEILSINGRPTPTILSALMPYARADGANDDKRRALLEARGFDRYETFDIFYGLLFQPGQRFALRARAAGESEVRSISVGAVDVAERQAAMRTTQRSDEGIGWSLTFPNPTTALLTMPDWVVYNTRWDWRGFLDAGFAEIDRRGVTKLIVDIRGNEGGNDCGDLIAARLIDAPVAREGYARRTRYRQAPAGLNQYLDTWDDSFRDWGGDAIARDDGFFDLRGEADVDQIEPRGPRFRGQVDILIDSQNSSATFQFANCIKTNRLGRLIGQPTGGNLRGINGGAFFFLHLPASGIEVDLPLIARFPLTPQPDAGIHPDVVMALTRDGIASGRDAALEFALS